MPVYCGRRRLPFASTGIRGSFYRQSRFGKHHATRFTRHDGSGQVISSGEGTHS